MRPINIINRPQEEFHERSVISLAERDVEEERRGCQATQCLGREVGVERELLSNAILRLESKRFLY